MHVQYKQESIEFWVQYYKALIAQQHQYQLGGGGLPVFKGYSQYQRGGGLGSIFRSLFRIAMPIVKTVGKQALVSGSRVVADIAQGRNVKESFKEHARQGVGALLHKAGDAIQSDDSVKVVARQGIGQFLHNTEDSIQSGKGKKRKKPINKKSKLNKSLSLAKRRTRGCSGTLSESDDIFIKGIK